MKFLQKDIILRKISQNQLVFCFEVAITDEFWRHPFLRKHVDILLLGQGLSKSLQ